MKNCFQRLLRLFLPSLLLIGELQAQKAPARPNIIYIMADDMGYADLSCYGRKTYTTPNLDKLAAEGMKFMNAYSAAPVCTPTRTALMTGRYPSRTEVGLLEPWVFSKRDSIIGLNARNYSLPALLKNAGYETALFGKWHLGRAFEFLPRQNGFDQFFGFISGGIDYFSHRGGAVANDIYEDNQPAQVEGYMTDLIGNRVTKFLKQSHSRPFFLSVQFNAPHWPWQGPADKALHDSIPINGRVMATMGTPEIYAAMMKSLDDHVGNIMKVLEETGLSKNTVVIFTSDNGGEKFSDMGGYSKGKMTLWEGGLRVPAFVRWPGQIKANSVSQHPVITMDWTATILAIAGAKENSAFPLDGQNITPVLLGTKKESSRIFYWRTFQRLKQQAIRDGNWKWLVDENGEYLFDLAKDPGEKNDVKANFPDKAAQLKKKYEEWEKTVLKPLPL